MSKKQDKEPEITAEFDLKHRITGAAVLLFLGVLVLPLLLGPPSKANKVDVNDEVTTVSGVEPANILSETDEPTVNATTVRKGIEVLMRRQPKLRPTNHLKTMLMHCKS